MFVKVYLHAMLWLVNVHCSSTIDPRSLLEWTNNCACFLHYTMGQTGQTTRDMTAALHSDFELSRPISLSLWYFYIGRV